MRTQKQLVCATLNSLGQQTIALQCELKVLQMDRNRLLDQLAVMDEEEYLLQSRIKWLKNKVMRELSEHKALMGPPGAGETQSQQPPLLPGDEWKTGNPPDSQLGA